MNTIDRKNDDMNIIDRKNDDMNIIIDRKITTVRLIDSK